VRKKERKRMVEIEEVVDDSGVRQRKTGADTDAKDSGTDEGWKDLSKGAGKLKKRILVEGDGPVIGTNKFVTVNYTGKLEDGTVFDSSLKPGRRALDFHVGSGQVIKGWDMGIASMTIGEKAELICHPDFGYGKTGAGGVIPPNATLHFEVELLEAEEGGSLQDVLSKVLFLVIVIVLFFVFRKYTITDIVQGS